MLLYKNILSLIVLALALILSACAVGPDFKPPASPTVKRYTTTPMSKALTAGSLEPKQHLQVGNAVSSQWWKLFHSTELNDVVAQAIANNPSLTAAKAALEGAQEAILQAAGPLYPQVNANAGYQRSKHAAFTPPSNLYTVGATVSYLVDVFGGTRRTIEQKQALAQNQLYQLGAAYLTLTGNVVSQSVTIASLRAQLAAVEGIVASDRENVKLVKDKQHAGKAARIDVLTAESQLANDLTLLPIIHQQLEIAEHALSVLVGQFPGSWSPPPFDLAKIKLPTDLPVSLPSELVHQRPDILAAEAQLHADSAAIGIAAAQMYPSITLTGSAAFDSAMTNTLFSKNNLLWAIAAGLTTPVFQGGSLTAQKRQAIDTFKADAAIYQQTVLQAFGQVADALRALKNDADLVRAEKTALDTAHESLVLQRVSYAAGKSDLLFLITAQRAYQLALQGYVHALGQRYQDTAQLFLAMGGDWPSRNDGRCAFL